MELSVNGTGAYAYTGGRPFERARPTIVFAHSAGADHSTFLLQSRYFAYHGWNALALDLPGHGRSAGSALRTIPALADWVIACMDAAGAADAVLVGHSMGSLIALDCAAREPERVRALALVGTAAPMQVNAALLEAARSDRHAALDMLTLWGLSSTAQRGGDTVPGMWMTGTYLRLIERAAPGVIHVDLQACHDYREGLLAAARVRCPTLFVLGSRDSMTPPRSAHDLRAAIATARTALLAGAGHALMAEQPDAVLDALIEFVQTVAPR